VDQVKLAGTTQQSPMNTMVRTKMETAQSKMDLLHDKSVSAVLIVETRLTL